MEEGKMKTFEHLKTLWLRYQDTVNEHEYTANFSERVNAWAEFSKAMEIQFPELITEIERLQNKIADYES